MKRRNRCTAFFIGLFFIMAMAGNAMAVDEIRVGVISPTTGWAAIFGQGCVNGAKLAFDEYNYEFNGVPIKVFYEDTKADVEVMRTKLDSLKNRDKVHLIIGPSLGHEGMAAVDWGARNPEVPMLIGYSAPEDITMRKATNSVIRPGWTGAQVIFNFGQYCARDLGYKKVIIVGQDYSYPWDQAAGFIRGFLENGGEKVERIWHPVEAVDFSSIMAKLMSMSKEYDAVLNNSGGAQVVSFFKQWKQFGLDKVYPQILGQANVPIVPMLTELGDSALGVYSSLHYYDGNPSEANRKFRENFKKKFGHFPDVISVQGYDAVHVAFKAMKAVNGKVDDPGKFIAALRQVKMSVDESPRGPFYFDKYANPVQNIYIKKVVKKDGRLMNEALKIYKEVSQFGPYADMADKYMAAPPTTRDYPPGDKAHYFKEIEKYFGKDYVEKLKKNNGWVD
ncbi:MAG: ABC transporter substrate-binding protein [Desulfobacterales bacterium]|nr:ABC transporter substrate-binding protein [Desulfobacterales bacterium]